MKTPRTTTNRAGLLVVLASQLLGVVLLSCSAGCTLQVGGGDTDPGFDDDSGGGNASSMPPKFLSRADRPYDDEPDPVADAGAGDAGDAHLVDAAVPADASAADAAAPRDAAMPRDATDRDACIPFAPCPP